MISQSLGMKKKVGILVETDSGRLYVERYNPDIPIAKPIITDTTAFVRNLFTSWKKLHQYRKKYHASHSAIGALFYEVLWELFDPKHRNLFLEMLEKEQKAKRQRR